MPSSNYLILDKKNKRLALLSDLRTAFNDSDDPGDKADIVMKIAKLEGLDIKEPLGLSQIVVEVNPNVCSVCRQKLDAIIADRPEIRQ